MPGQANLDRIELERIDRDLHALLEAEQTAHLRAVLLPVGYEKSQALAEYSNAVAVASAMRQKRDRFLTTLMQIIGSVLGQWGH